MKRGGFRLCCRAALGFPQWYIKVCKLVATQWERYGKSKRDIKVMVNERLTGGVTGQIMIGESKLICTQYYMTC